MARVRLTGEERREHLLDTAARLIVEQGIAALTMERLAATSGVSKALPYQHFDNADDLVVALYRREMTIVGTRIATAMDGARAGSFEDVVRAGIHTYFDLLVERGTLLAVLANADKVRRMQEDVDTGARQYLAEVFERSTGLDRRTGEIAAAVVLSALPGGVDAWVQRRAPRREIEEVLTLVIAAGVGQLATRGLS